MGKVSMKSSMRGKLTVVTLVVVATAAGLYALQNRRTSGTGGSRITVYKTPT
jgi:hypothetical protein